MHDDRAAGEHLSALAPITRELITPKARTETFAGTIAEALRLGWSAELCASRDVLQDAERAQGTSLAERAVCRALRALVALALGETAHARQLARQAISATARPSIHLQERQLRSLRLARALAVTASDLAGDRTRARRAMLAKFVLADPEVQWIIPSGTERPWESAPPGVQPLVRFVAAVRARRIQPRGPLSATEIRVLEEMSRGGSATQVGARLQRSPLTVRTHLRNAYRKLDVSGLRAALAQARALGVLPKDDSTDP